MHASGTVTVCGAGVVNDQISVVSPPEHDQEVLRLTGNTHRADLITLQPLHAAGP